MSVIEDTTERMLKGIDPRMQRIIKTKSGSDAGALVAILNIIVARQNPMRDRLWKHFCAKIHPRIRPELQAMHAVYIKMQREADDEPSLRLLNEAIAKAKRIGRRERAP